MVMSESLRLAASDTNKIASVEMSIIQASNFGEIKAWFRN
jgi:hypothetical protein